MTAAVAILATLGWGASRAFDAWWYNAELTKAEGEIASKQYAPAQARLARLSARWRGWDEVEYPLGVCEAALGRVEPALDAWQRVPADSVMAPRAALERAKFAIEHGRLAAAEESLAPILRRSDEIGEQAGKLADQLNLYSGRGRLIGRRIEERGGSARDLAGQLRLHWLLDSQPFAVRAVREALERLGAEAPDDDRIWLGRADLATRTGAYDEAEAWLKRCEARRPDDLDVRQARLGWALDSGKADEAARVLGRLPADRFSLAEVAAIDARLAALRGHPDEERAALERRVALEPGDAPSWGRLADLAASRGPAGLLTRARRRKAEIDSARDHYQILMSEVAAGDLSRAAELAKTAESLGRRFEAKGWWTIRARQAPDETEARPAFERLSRAEPPKAPAGRTLADLIASRSVAKAEATSNAGSASAIPAFRDDAEAAGLRFVYENDKTPLRRLPETMGGGVGLIDFDGDGRLDVYAVQGGTFPSGDLPSGEGDRLFRNRGDGSFEDVTTRSGIAGFSRGYGHGVTVGDYDNDGHPDLFITRWRAYALYRNKGDGTFEDATKSVGLGGERGWPTSAAFADLDNDGDLDLYVCQYLKWDPVTSPPCPDADRPGTHNYCVPRTFEAEPDRVFRNDGGRFTDVTDEAGFVDLDGRGLGVVAADVDDDGLVDLFVANDMTANFLFRNLGGFRFQEQGAERGVATNASGGYQAGMGVAAGDLDGDGAIDLAVTNFYGESTTFFRNLGGGQFADFTSAIGLAAPSRFLLGFGLALLDANNDGRLDMASANGHVNDFGPAIPYAMPAQLLLGVGEGRLEDVSGRAGPPWQVPRLGRGLASGDVDDDGRVDLLILSENEPLAYLHNAGATPPGHYVTLRLQGTSSNRDAVGTRLILTAGGRRQVTQRFGGGSFLSANDGRVHLGLGPSSRVESVEVRWPSGKSHVYRDLPADSEYILKEGDPTAAPIKKQ